MTHSQLQSSHQVMQAKTSELEETNDKLLSTDKRMNQGCDELKGINAELEQSIKEFNQLCVDVKHSIENQPSSESTQRIIAESNSVIADFDELCRNPDILNICQQSRRDGTDNTCNNTPR